MSETEILVDEFDRKFREAHARRDFSVAGEYHSAISYLTLATELDHDPVRYFRVLSTDPAKSRTKQEVWLDCVKVVEATRANVK